MTDERRCEECQHFEDEHSTGPCDVCDCDTYWSPLFEDDEEADR